MGDFLALGGRNIEPTGGAHWWPDWGAVIRDLWRSELPYISSGVDILDATYGRGVFWSRLKAGSPSGHPANVVANDIDPDRDVPHRWDWLRAEPPEEWLSRFWAAIVDPPFKLSGTNRILLDRYGLDDNANNQHRLNALETGTLNVARCVRPGGYLLVKCQPQVAGGKVRWQPRTVANRLEAEGWLIEDEVIAQYRSIPQPGNRTQQHARRNYSVMVIAQAPKETR